MLKERTLDPFIIQGGYITPTSEFELARHGIETINSIYHSTHDLYEFTQTPAQLYYDRVVVTDARTHELLQTYNPHNPNHAFSRISYDPAQHRCYMVKITQDLDARRFFVTHPTVKPDSDILALDSSIGLEVDLWDITDTGLSTPISRAFSRSQRMTFLPVQNILADNVDQENSNINPPVDPTLKTRSSLLHPFHNVGVTYIVNLSGEAADDQVISEAIYARGTQYTTDNQYSLTNEAIRLFHQTPRSSNEHIESRVRWSKLRKLLFRPYLKVSHFTQFGNHDLGTVIRSFITASTLVTTIATNDNELQVPIKRPSAIPQGKILTFDDLFE